LSLYFVFGNTISILLIDSKHYKEMKKLYLCKIRRSPTGNTRHMSTNRQSKIQQILSLYFTILNTMNIKSSVLKYYIVIKKLYLCDKSSAFQTPNIEIDDLPQSQIEAILSLYFSILNQMSILLRILKHYKETKKVYLWQMASERQFGVFFSRDYN
jgi:hypothetical protein